VEEAITHITGKPVNNKIRTKLVARDRSEPPMEDAMSKRHIIDSSPRFASLDMKQPVAT
jgi:hypothetical protein